MKTSKVITTILLATSLIGATAVTTTVFVTPTAVVSAAGTTNVQNRALSKSYVVYGAGASDQSTLASTLGVTDNYTKLTTTGADAATYLNISGVADSAMISSVSIAPAEPGTGTLVNIKDYNGQNNITQVTSQQYAMAATMAGVNDVIITVTANSKVSGEAALAGVYKALATDGINLDESNTTAANDMLSATQIAVNENANDSSYPGKLTSAVTTTAGELAEKKQDGTNITVNVAINQLNVNLDKQGIAGKTSEAAVQQMGQALVGVANAPISDSKAFVDNAKDLSNKLENSAGDIMAKAKDFANSEDVKEAANWFVTNIWNPLVNFFKGLFNN